MSIIAHNLKKIMEERNLNSFSLEKKAKLKVNVINSILSGRSNNPKMTTLIAISKALNLSIDKIVGLQTISEDKNKESHSSQENQYLWDYNLSIKCLKLISNKCTGEDITLSLHQVELIHRSIYELAMKKFFKETNDKNVEPSPIEPDEIYADVLIDHIAKNF